MIGERGSQAVLDLLADRVDLLERVSIPDAALRQEGPYASSLEMAIALENETGAEAVRDLCEQHGMHLETINRTLLRLISSWRSQTPRW